MTGQQPPTAATAADEGLAGVVRSSQAMAVGTVASRVTGFLRTAVIADAIGLSVGDAYNVANTVPNIVYELLLGGVLTSVVVPLLVAAAKRDEDEGQAYAQRLLTLVFTSLLVASALAVAAAPLVARLYAASFPGPKLALTTTFARFFLPQILFYGVGALIGAILNVRGSFAPPMWAPVLNNIVVIATGGVFIAITSHTPVPGQLSTGQELVLGIGTTVGVVAQTVALLPYLRATGFRWRLRFDFRDAGLRPAGALAGWVFVYVLANQVAFVVIVRLAAAAGHALGQNGSAFSPYIYAFVLVSLPHAVVAVSVITALLPRMSRNAVEGRLPAVADDLAGGLKLAGVVLVPAQLVCIALGPLIATVVFAHGNIGLSDARMIGAVLAAYAVSLVPFSAFQLQLRAFYALHDSRTPALVNIGVNVVNVVADVVLYVTLPARERVIGLAVGYSLSYIGGFAVFTGLLRRRIGVARGQHVLRTYARLGVAAALGTGLAYLLARLITDRLGLGWRPALLALTVGVAAGGAVFLAAAARMRVDELRQLRGLAGRRAG